MVLLPELLVPSNNSLISRRCRWLSERKWRSIRRERRAASFSSELWRHPMVLHHVVNPKELVLLLDGEANSNEVVTEYVAVEGEKRGFCVYEPSEIEKEEISQ